MEKGLNLSIMERNMSSVHYDRHAIRPCKRIREEFPLGFWCGPPTDMISFERYSEIADAGFTFTMPGVGDNTRDKDILTYTNELGMSAILGAGQLHYKRFADIRKLEEFLVAHGETVVSNYFGYSSLLGFRVADEPNASKFQMVALVKDFLSNHFPGIVPYVNLYPNYATTNQLGVESYEEYVDAFIRVVRPLFLSFDFYPFTAARQGEDRSVMTGFYANLELIRQKSLEHNLDFWTFVQTCSFRGMRNPSPQEVRWHTYHNLAYGAKGMQYFLYWSLKPGNREEISNGIMDWDGTKTQHYDTVTQLNSEMRVLGPIVLKLRSKGVYFSRMLPSELAMNYEPEWLLDITEGNVLAGVFSDTNSNNYMLVVNREFTCKASIKIVVKDTFSSVFRVSKVSGELEKIESITQSGECMIIQMQLAEGDGELLQFA
jgi:hypothetical protein